MTQNDIQMLLYNSLLQDLFVDRLVERVDKLKEEIAMFEAQITAQVEETKAAKEALGDAHMEIEVCSTVFICKSKLFKVGRMIHYNVRPNRSTYYHLLKIIMKARNSVVLLKCLKLKFDVNNKA